MKALALPRTATNLLIAMFLILPAAAQNEQADPHSHDWMKEQVVPKLKQQQQQGVEAQTTTTTTTAPTQSPAVDALNQSLGGVNSSYHGAHQWYKDDQIGLIAVTVIAVLGILGIALFAARTKKKD